MGQNALGDCERPEDCEFTDVRSRWAGNGIDYEQSNTGWVSVVQFRDDGPCDARFDPVPEYVLSFVAHPGRFRRSVRGGRLRELTLMAQDCVLLNPDNPIRIQRDDPVMGVDLLLPRKLLDEFIVQHASDAASAVEVPDQAVVNDLLLSTMARELAVQADLQLQGGNPAMDLYADTLGHAIAARLVAHHSNFASRRVRKVLDEKVREVPPAVPRAREYIHAHLGRRLTLAEIADVACLSPYHFARIFKNAVGVPPHVYLMEQRVQRASTLLLKTNAPIAAVANECGFGSQSHFSTAFRKRMGVTPSVYRKLQRAD